MQSEWDLDMPSAASARRTAGMRSCFIHAYFAARTLLSRMSLILLFNDGGLVGDSVVGDRKIVLEYG